jgi:DNA modification methylase
MNDDIPVSELKPIIEAAFKNIESVLAKKSSYYVCSPQGGELGLMMMMMQDAGLPCRHMIVWVKNAPVFSMGRLDYDYQHEPILYGWSKNRTHYFAGKGEFTKSVWSVSREPNKLHPTMKPISLIENAVMNSSDPGMLVIDFFLGSGSTLIACEKNNRRCFGMEIDPQYCQVILERWKGVTGKEWEKIG